MIQLYYGLGIGLRLSVVLNFTALEKWYEIPLKKWALRALKKRDVGLYPVKKYQMILNPPSKKTDTSCR